MRVQIMSTDRSQLPTDLIFPAEASELLGVKETTMATWRSTGRYELNYYRLFGRVKYSKADVLDFVNSSAEFVYV